MNFNIYNLQRQRAEGTQNTAKSPMFKRWVQWLNTIWTNDKKYETDNLSAPDDNKF